MTEKMVYISPFEISNILFFDVEVIGCDAVLGEGDS